MRSSAGRMARAVAAAVAALAVMSAVAMAGDSATGYLLRGREQTGFRVSGSPQVAPTAVAYVREHQLTGATARTVKRLLTGYGFTGSAQEQLVGAGGRQGFSLVATFSRKSGPVAASNYLYTAVYDAEYDEHAHVRRFLASGVATLRGVLAVEGRVATVNVYWTEGRCALGSGAYFPAGARLSTAGAEAPVVAGVRAQRARMRGRCT